MMTPLIGCFAPVHDDGGRYGLLLATQRIGPLYNRSTTPQLPVACTGVQSTGTACTGGGDSASTRWSYNQQRSACESFEFQGCGGNANNFATAEQCDVLCRPSYVHSATIDTALVADGIGVSLLLVTFTSQQQYAAGRSEFLTTSVSL